MSDDYTLNPSALEADGKTFDAWSQELDAYVAGIPTNLVESDFSWIPGASEVWSRWQAAKESLGTYIAQGSDMMDGFARTLLETVRSYLEAEGLSQDDIDRVTRELSEL